jgi:hypothetical protein
MRARLLPEHASLKTRRTRQGQAGMDQLGRHGGLALIQRRRRRVYA